MGYGLSGIVHNLPGWDPTDRVLAVQQQGHVLRGETSLEADGSWGLEVHGQVDYVVVQVRGSRLAAAAVSVGESAQVSLPELVRVQFELFGPDANVEMPLDVYLDPVDLEGFPPSLLWALTASLTEGAQTVDLHVGAKSLAEGSACLQVQRGSYVISGGTHALGPLGVPGQQIDRLVDRASGSIHRTTDHDVELRIDSDSTFLVAMASA